MKLIIALLFAGVAFAQQHSVTLTWTWTQGKGGAATGFNVKRSDVSGGPYTKINADPIAPDTLTYVDTTGLVEGSKYFYVVTATGLGGESANSGEAVATIPFSVPEPSSAPSVVVK